MPQKTVCIDDVVYQYPKQQATALKHLSLDVEQGEVVAIMGPTGAGKTTLALLLNGLIPQFYEGEFSGEVTVNNLSTREVSTQDLVKHVGLVLQDSETQIFGITVLEDTAFGPSNLGYAREEIFSRVNEALAQVRLSGYEDRLTSNLSGGEKQRLAIAGLLAMKPSIIVLDEPTSELDPLGRLDVVETIQNLRTQNQTTVIFIDHEAESVLQLADRLYVMGDGEISWVGEPKALFQNVALTKQFSIRPPIMAELGENLRNAGLFSNAEQMLTVEDAERIIRKLMKGTPFSSLISYEPESPKVTPVSRSPILEIHDLVHAYPGGIETLSGISCTIGQGELVAIIGQNGAGKSTLVKHFNGLLRPTSGTVKVDGVDTSSLSVSELARQVGYVFQNPDHQIFSATVAEELQFGLENLGLSEEDQETRLNEALEFVGLQDQRDRHPFMLAKGERQKVAVASILAIAPPIICIDEPTTGLDWVETELMMTLIRKLHQKGHTILMITHNMELVADYAERVLVINQGQLRLDGTPSSIFKETQILRECRISPPPVSQLVEKLGDLDCPQDICTISQLTSVISGSIQAESAHV